MATALKEGDRVFLSGDSSEFWLSDYNVRVCSPGTVAETPAAASKKVLVTIDSIDGESNVCAYVRKSKLKAV